jgi:flagellar FliL protein
MSAINRLAFVAVIVSAATAVLMAAGLVVGGIALNARLHPQKKVREVAPLPGPLVTIPEQTYNLGEANRYARLTIMLELDAAGKSAKQMAMFQEEIQKRDPQIRDIVIRVINTRTFAEANSPRGKVEMKNEIKKQVNHLLARGAVKTVLFTSFAAQ